jgi:DNA-binding PadR family transcriptional regulator
VNRLPTNKELAALVELQDHGPATIHKIFWIHMNKDLRPHTEDIRRMLHRLMKKGMVKIIGAEKIGPGKYRKIYDTTGFGLCVVELVKEFNVKHGGNYEVLPTGSPDDTRRGPEALPRAVS